MPVSRRQPPGACGSGTATASRSASGSFAITRSALTLRAVSNARSIAPGSSGFGKATVGNAAVRLELRVDGDGCGVAGDLEDARERLPSHAVHRGVDPGEAVGALGRGRDGGGRGDVGLHERLGRRLVAQRTRQGADVAGIRDPLDVRGDLGVGRRDDLRAVVVAAEVDLVAVVVRGVVARGHHDPGIRPQFAHREGEHRRRQQPRQEDRAEPGAGEQLGGVPGEHVGVAASVVPDHDGRSAVGARPFEDEGGEARPRPARRAPGSSGCCPRRVRRADPPCRTRGGRRTDRRDRRRRPRRPLRRDRSARPVRRGSARRDPARARRER